VSRYYFKNSLVSFVFNRALSLKFCSSYFFDESAMYFGYTMFFFILEFKWTWLIEIYDCFKSFNDLPEGMSALKVLRSVLDVPSVLPLTIIVFWFGRAL